MSLISTPAFIGIVDEGHIISVPPEVPVGAKVAILLLPSVANDGAEAERKERFAGILAAIRSAIAAGHAAPAIPDEEIDQRIAHARHQKPD